MNVLSQRSPSYFFRVKTVTYMHKRKAQNQTDRFPSIFNFIFCANNLKFIHRKELDEELEYLEAGQASQSK